ncbi:MAG TPA: NAD(P)-dependent oxidoreductase [Gemmatimonadales bacterium]|nr:NAD(P)-dependent oxidoreductase [Gemmatimonadales bacterium]
MKLGFLGLGAMGSPIAANLLAAGHDVTVYNRTRARAEALAAKGAHVAGSVADAASHPVAMTMLSDDAAAEDVCFGRNGILESLPLDGVHVSLSTIGADLSRRLTEAHAAQGQHFVAAPVFGRPDAAASQRLVVVAAGQAAAVARVREPLEDIGRELFVIGEDPPAANVLKLAGNFLIVSVIEVLGEAFALLRKAGVEPAAFLEIVNGSLIQSPVYGNYGRLVAEQRFEPAGFKLRLGLKDVRLLLAAADAHGVPMPAASLLRDDLLTAVANGMGDLDWAALAEVSARRAGL